MGRNPRPDHQGGRRERESLVMQTRPKEETAARKGPFQLEEEPHFLSRPPGARRASPSPLPFVPPASEPVLPLLASTDCGGGEWSRGRRRSGGPSFASP